MASADALYCRESALADEQVANLEQCLMRRAVELQQPIGIHRVAALLQSKFIKSRRKAGPVPEMLVLKPAQRLGMNCGLDGFAVKDEHLFLSLLNTPVSVRSSTDAALAR